MSSSARYFPCLPGKSVASPGEHAVHGDDTRVDRRSITRYPRCPRHERARKEINREQGGEHASFGRGGPYATGRFAFEGTTYTRERVPFSLGRLSTRGISYRERVEARGSSAVMALTEAHLKPSPLHSN